MAQAIRALLVDDDPMIRAVLAAFFESRGYSVQESSDGVEALERLRDGGFNLVVTDRHMPRMDGLALCRAIRTLPAAGYVYCVMLTGSTDEKALVAAMEAGVDDFISKPLQVAELGARLRAAERVLALEAGLATRNAELSRAYGQLSRDLDMARTLQRSQLPAPQSFGAVRCEGWFEPSSFVGGDLYDYFPLGDRLLGFYLADISGHGVAAAMMAVSTQHQLRAASNEIVRSITPDSGLAQATVAIVQRYNEHFLRMNETGMYLTLVYGLLDRATGQLALVGAGHPAPLVAGPGEAAFRPVGEGSVPVGILPDPGWEAQTLQLAPGSRVVLYSDGVTECAGAQGAGFGDERLRQLLARERYTDLTATCAAVGTALHAWHPGGFEDDVTLLAVEVG